jgi:hypothetical protein
LGRFYGGGPQKQKLQCTRIEVNFQRLPISKQPSIIMTELNGKIAIVTGSSSGIGFAIAEKLARKGAALSIVGLGV